MNISYGYHTSPRHRNNHRSPDITGKDKTLKKNSPFKNIKLPNFSKFLDKAFGDGDSRKSSPQYHGTIGSSNTSKRNLVRRTMSHSGHHNYSSQTSAHFATARRYPSNQGQGQREVTEVKERSLPEPPPGGQGRGQWNVCQCDPSSPPPSSGHHTTTRRGSSSPPGSAPAPSANPAPPAAAAPAHQRSPPQRFSIHRYPLGMYNIHDDVTGQWYFLSFYYTILGDEIKSWKTSLVQGRGEELEFGNENKKEGGSLKNRFKIESFFWSSPLIRAHGRLWQIWFEFN